MRPGPDQSGEPENLAAAHGERDVADSRGAAGQPARLQHDFADRDLALGEDGVDVAAHHQADQLRAVHVAQFAGGDGVAVAQDGDAVGDGGDFVQAVRDVDDARAFAAQRLDDAEEALHFAFGERGGGLVENQDLGARADRLGDLDDLLLRHAERAHGALGVDVGAGALEQFARLACARRPIDLAPQAGALERERDVLRHGEVREQRGLLVDGGDAERVRDAQACCARPGGHRR